MTKIIFGMILLSSFSIFAQNNLTTLSVFAANSAICKEKIKDQMSEDSISCVDDFRNAKFMYKHTIQTYPGIDVYEFTKTLTLNSKNLICSGEIKISFYDSLTWVDGMGLSHDVQNVLSHQVSKLICK